MRAPSRYLTGSILVLTGILLVAGSLALHSWGSKTVVTSSGIAPPLSSAERATLVRDGSTVSALPRALGEVTEAMSDAARSASGSPLSPTRAGDLLFEQPELTPLLHAVEHPRQVADSLARGLRPARRTTQVPLLSVPDELVFFVLPGALAVMLGVALRARRLWSAGWRLAPILAAALGLVVLAGVFAPIDSGATLWTGARQSTTATATQVNPTAIEGDLSQLEAVYDDVVPALQYAGAAGHRVLDPESAVQVLAQYPELHALNGFVTNFSELYGVGVLITQQAAGVSAAPNLSTAMHWLGWIGIAAGLVLVLLGLTGGLAARRRDGVAPATADADDAGVFSGRVAGSTT